MKNKKLSYAIIIGVVVISAYFLLDKKSNNTIETTQNSQTATTTSDVQVVVGADGKNYTVKKISEETIPAIKSPDLNKQVFFDSKLGFTIEQRQLINSQIISIQSSLKKDMTDMSAWLDLGMYYKMAGDYLGAAEVWKFVSDYSQKDFVSLGNLGDLYAYYLNDKVLSETYYKRAIKNDPKRVYLYTQLSGVYRDVFKDIDKARFIIEEGLKANPDDPTLLEFKASLK